MKEEIVSNSEQFPKTEFRDLPNKQQFACIILSMAGAFSFIYFLLDILGFIKTTNPVWAAREAKEPLVRMFWPTLALLSAFICMVFAKIMTYDYSDGARAALRRFMREMRIK